MTTETQTPATGENSQTPAVAAPAPNAGATLLTADSAQTPAAQPAQTTEAAPGSTEQEPAETKPAEAKPQGAPEEYAEFVAPEGVTFNPEVMTKFKALAKEKGLSQEDAQQLADLGAEAAQAQRNAFVDHVTKAQAQWAEAARTDKEFGGDNLDENMAVAKRALDTFGSPELSTLLKESGLGNHPEIIRAFYRAGKAISEDRLVPGGKKPDTSDPAKKMFPTMN